ncbi:MAG: ABC transporter ATP-binding protein [Hyphomicrobiaceae bacterium]
MPENLLEIADLCSGYGAGDILQGINLSFGRGEIVAVVGRNGVGKTTLMKTIMGLLVARRGNIRFAGSDITNRPAEDRARGGLGYVPQGKQIFSDLTVEENLRMGERINLSKPSNWELVFEYFPILKRRLGQNGRTLSGGEQQALAIGRALVGQPEALLLDEPSESIQPSIIIEIGKALERLNRETGLTIILVEQNLGLIEAVSHRGYVLDKGKTTAILSSEDIADRTVMLGHLSV